MHLVVLELELFDDLNLEFVRFLQMEIKIAYLTILLETLLGFEKKSFISNEPLS